MSATAHWVEERGPLALRSGAGMLLSLPHGKRGKAGLGFWYDSEVWVPAVESSILWHRLQGW